VNRSSEEATIDVAARLQHLHHLASLLGAVAAGNGCARFAKDARVPEAVAGVVLRIGLRFA